MISLIDSCIMRLLHHYVRANYQLSYRYLKIGSRRFILVLRVQAWYSKFVTDFVSRWLVSCSSYNVSTKTKYSNRLDICKINNPILNTGHHFLAKQVLPLCNWCNRCISGSTDGVCFFRGWLLEIHSPFIGSPMYWLNSFSSALNKILSK